MIKLYSLKLTTLNRYLALGLMKGIKFYQRYISGLLGGRCRFVPSCSDYAYLAINKYGALKGLWLAFRRLMRCHPASLSKSWVDPVP